MLHILNLLYGGSNVAGYLPLKDDFGRNLISQSGYKSIYVIARFVIDYQFVWKSQLTWG